jgi:alpha-L-fucosidase
MKKFAKISIIALAGILLIFTAACKGKEELLVGYGRAVITPPLGTPCALGLDDNLVEVFDDLYVRALWLELEGRAALVIAADVIGIYAGDVDEFSAQIGEAVSVPKDNIFLHSTHTHQTANSRWQIGELLKPYGLEEQFSSSEFKELMARGLMDAARQAKSSAVPCEMAYAEYPVKDIASNRRIPVEDGAKVVFRSSRPPAELREKPKGMIDPLCRIVLFRSLKDGSLAGIVNYSCHPSAAGGDEGPYATGDFPGRGMAIAEKQTGNLRLLHLTGTCGEINPGKYVLSDSLAPEDRKRDVELMGQRYADAILAALREAKDWHSASGLDFRRESFGLTLQKNIPTLPEVRKKLADSVAEYQKNKAEGKTQPGKVRGLFEEYALSQSREGRLMTQAAALRIGDIRFAFIPGEIMLRFGEELRDRIGRPRLLNVSCSLDSAISYVVPQLYFDQGGYEPTATRLAPEAYDELKEKMVGLLTAVGTGEGNGNGQSPAAPAAEKKLGNDPKKTEIFRDAGLGLFIHWGINSQMGTEISWPLFNASDDYIEKYYALAKTFNPVRFDPDEWARLAKLAGMEYVVFTAKHHDGFCMFDSAYSDFKITRTPFGRDITAMIADSFRKQGILVGFYYSPADFRYQYETGQRLPRLYEPDFGSAAPFGPKKLSFVDYELGQVEELLTRYGDVFQLWFDGKCEPLKKRAWEIKPAVFIGRGEIPTPEQTIPGEAQDQAWESCLTTSVQWSYKPMPDIRTPREVIENLIHIRARGGNMLLNVGPRPDGLIAGPDEDLLRELGLWMMLYGEGVRGVRPWVVTNEGNVWLTHRRSDGTVYAFVDLDYSLKEPGYHAGRDITLKSITATPQSRVTLLSQAGECEWNEDDGGLHIKVRRKHTVQLIRAQLENVPLEGGGERTPLTWGPDWPVVVKITQAKPAPEFVKKEE